MADFARGQLLTELRDARHLSQERAALDIGVSAKSLREWEHGGKIRWENAQRVGTFYGVDPERLVSRTENGSEPPPIDLEADQLDRIEQKLDAVLRHLKVSPDDVREFAAAFETGADGEAPAPPAGKPAAKGSRPRAA